VLEDDDDDLPLNQPMGDRMSMVNPMLGNYGFVPSPTAQGWNPWQQQPFMMAPPVMQADPNLLAAHQQAMMYAKQAYQMAVAQQAIAAAGEEWERGSSVSGMGGSNLGGGMFGLGGVPFMGMAPGMGMGMGMGMMGGMQASWAPGTMLYPPGGFGSAQSDIGVATGGRGNAANWGSRSVYGESFGPPSAPATRNSMAYGESKESSAPTSRPMQRMSFASPSSQASARPGVGARPRQRTASVPSSTLFPGPPPGAPARKIAPPSSWKQRDGSG
jgi:serine/arginine repetitive matrix protein 2